MINNCDADILLTIMSDLTNHIKEKNKLKAL